MGTEVQSKMHLPGYYSLRDLNDSTSKVSWPPHHEHKSFEQQFNFLSTRRGMDTGYDKEQLRQTILKHESLFRHQVHELHRLYRVQRDMMNEMKSRDLNKHLTCASTAQSTSFSPTLLSQDEPKSHVLGSRMLDSNCSSLYINGEDSSHSQYNHLKGNYFQNGSGLKNGELLEFQHKNVQRRLFDLERPADDYRSNENGDPGVSSGSVVENFPSRRIHDVPPHREGKFAVRNDGSYNCNGDVNASNLYPWGNRGYADLNGPTQVQEIHLETERKKKGWLSFSLENGCKGGTGSFSGCFYPEELHKQHKPVQIESTKVQPSKIETIQKRKIFGVEIPDRSSDDAASLVLNGTSASGPHSIDQLTVGLQADKTKSEVFSVSSWNKFPSIWNQNFSGNTGNGASDQFNGRPRISMQDDRVAEGRLLSDSDSSSIPYLKADVLYRNGLNFGSTPESKESRVFCSSLGFSNQNGTSRSPCLASEKLVEDASRKNFKGLGSMVEPKPLVDLNMDALPVNSDQNESNPQSNVNGVRYQENLHPGLTWLYNGKSTKEGNTNSSTKKILGFPTFGVESKDVASTSSPLKSTFSASANETDPLPEKGVTNHNSASRQQIDLNLWVDEEEVEEEAPPPSLSSKTSTRIRPVIDLEMPAATDTDIEFASGNESLGDSEPQQLSSDSAAAEMLMALSSSKIYNHPNNDSTQKLETSEDDSLHWFAEIISSHQSDSETDDDDGLDYFELMTLNLTETKLEECRQTPLVLENQKDEKPMTRRPRRGQARRGRQRKDFQRDILPNLTSLSRNEVTQDLQEIEGLIQATGGYWQSSLTQKINARSSSARGKKRSGSGGSLPPISETPCLNPVNQAEAVTPERSLTGWGKRTRRPPRQRCSIAITTPLSVKV